MRFLLFILLLSSVSAAAQPPRNFKVIAYFSGRAAQLDSFDVNRITHLIYCFGHLKGDQFHLSGARDTAMIRKMVELKKKNPALKVLLSLGGWGGCAPCSEVFARAEHRKAFAQSVLGLSTYFGTDGIDLDWEYPTIEGYPGHKFAPEDKEHFTDLVRLLKQTLGPDREVSFAAGGFQSFLDHSVDWTEVMKWADYVNLMSYDLINGFSKETGHHTALFSTARQRESTDNAVQYLLRKGITPEKIVIGAAFYGRVWKDVPPAAHGLGQPGTFLKAEAYPVMEAYKREGFQYHWDDTAQAPYLYHPGKQQFATYDDPRSIRRKAEYVVQHGLRGIMFWELSHDLPQQVLLQEIIRVRNGK